jgi:hypothetical protein
MLERTLGGDVRRGSRTLAENGRLGVGSGRKGAWWRRHRSSRVKPEYGGGRRGREAEARTWDFLELAASRARAA